MPNFSIFTQITNELKDYFGNKVKIAAMPQTDGTLRYLKKQTEGYFYNQYETLMLIDLYHNSKFSDGEKDKLGQTKIFMNVGKFRSEVAAKQIVLKLKDFKFSPEDYADPYTSVFMQKDFDQWAQDTYFAEQLDQCVDNFPKYGSVVMKEVGDELHYMPLQLLRMEQTAKNLQVATYVIEEHPDMTLSEMQDMPEWNCDGITLKFNETATVYERYGRVPLAWLKGINKEPVLAGDAQKSVDALVICTTKVISGVHATGHVFYAGEVKKGERPYREAHWTRQHGRWLGIGEMENQFANQTAKNIVINLLRRSLHWSSKRIFTTAVQELIGKNLVRDVKDGDVLDVGTGSLNNVDMSIKSLPEFNLFMQEFEKNSDQKSFTYEVATGESTGNMPYRLGVVLSNAVNSHFKKKQSILGNMLQKGIIDFLIPQFLKDMGNKERVIQMFSNDAGYEFIKDAAMKWVQQQASHISMLSGKPIDGQGLSSILSPYMAANSLPFTIASMQYKEAKWKFNLDLTGDSADLAGKLQTLQSLYQSLAQVGDQRAEAVLARIGALTGEDMSQFGPKPAPTPATTGQGTAVPSPMQKSSLPDPNALANNGQG